MNTRRRSVQGFTIIELVLVVVVLCVLGTVVAVTYSGVQANNRNDERQADIDVTQSHLEMFYALHDVYPSLAQLNDPAWRVQNVKELKDDKLQDPKWSTELSCTQNSKAILGDTPSKGCYSYQITAADGAFCDNNQIKCGRYTLTAMLENGETYVKTSLN